MGTWGYHASACFSIGATADGGSHPPGELSKVHLPIGLHVHYLENQFFNDGPVAGGTHDCTYQTFVDVLLSTCFSHVSRLSNVAAHILTRS